MYASLIALQNDTAKIILWRYAAVITPRSGSSGTTQNKGKVHMPTQSYTRPHGSIVQSNHGSYGSFGGNDSKGLFGNRGSWEHPKDAKADCKKS